jgi:tetratricopeptide (TPR) repeat protein
MLRYVVATFVFACASTLPAADYDEAFVAFQKGDYTTALAAAEQATNTHFSDVRWWRLRLECLNTLGRYAEGAETLKLALRQYHVDGTIRLLGYEILRHHGEPQQARDLIEELLRIASGSPWRFHSPTDRVGLGRAAVVFGIDARQILEQFFDQAKKADPDLRDVYLGTGELALAKHDDAVAAETYRAALEKYPNDADFLCGLAQSLGSSSSAERAVLLDKALQQNPHHLPSLFLAADDAIDHEDYAAAQTALAKVIAVNPNSAKAWALAAVLAHLRADPIGERLCRDVALRGWPKNPEVDHVIGAQLSGAYRFAEGAAHQRQSLEFDPDYQPARTQLAQDLLRLGEADEGWRLVAEVQRADEYDVVAYNLATLHDRLQNYTTLETPKFRVHMEAKEAAVYGPRVLALLERARTTLGDKYGWQPSAPVTVEILTQQSDFAIRTFGLPGGDGILGVCFGTVITANSPAALAGRNTSWEATLWHEYCHVVTLERTHHRIPRWLSEGISVYEERQADPTWGNRLDKEMRQMILEGELARVGQLNRAFRNPKSGAHFNLAYLQASLVVEYLVDTLGHAVLRRVLADVAAGLPINDSLELRTGSLAGFEKAFDTYARKRAASAMDDDENEHADSLAAYRRAIDEAVSKQDTAMIAKYVERYLGINPLEEYPYRTAARHLGEGKHLPQAVAAARALVALEPADRSGAHFLLAQRLHAARDAEAKRHALLALEETPRYREARELLLQIFAEGLAGARKPTQVEP